MILHCKCDGDSVGVVGVVGVIVVSCVRLLRCLTYGVDLRTQPQSAGVLQSSFNMPYAHTRILLIFT